MKPKKGRNFKDKVSQCQTMLRGRVKTQKMVSRLRNGNRIGNL